MKHITEFGEVVFFNDALRQRSVWQQSIEMLCSPYYSRFSQAPLFISEALLTKVHYTQHFPHQLYNAVSFHDKDHACFITPAVCYHVYDHIHHELTQGYGELIIGDCARHENKTWSLPFRSSHFQMMELVLVGSAEEISIRRAELQLAVEHFFKSHHITGSFVSATDAFFLPNGKGAQLMQKIKQTKKEFTTNYQGTEVALASLNYHETYFTDIFNVTINGERAHSLCLAFGIDRLIAATI